MLRTEANKSVFIVDDDNVFIELTKQMFQQINSNITVKTFHDGLELLGTLSKGIQPPNLIVLDLNMPGLSGIETLKALRSKENSAEVPIIMLSSSDDKNLINACYSNQASSFIHKPNNPNGIIEVVETMSLLVKYLDNQSNSLKN